MTGKELRKLRKKHGLTQAEAAKLLGYKRVATISDIERGLNKISRRNAIAIDLTFSMYSDMKGIGQ